jgi:hypothetical protein
MGKKSLPMDVNYQGIQPGLGKSARDAIKECRALDDAYDKGVEQRANQVKIHAAALAKATKKFKK